MGLNPRSFALKTYHGAGSATPSKVENAEDEDIDSISENLKTKD
jgi:hypothetical protein